MDIFGKTLFRLAESIMGAILDKMREGISRIIDIDPDIAHIVRNVVIDNGRGNMIPTGEVVSFEISPCRISHESLGAWHFKNWEGGIVNGQTPYICAKYDSDILPDDIVTWRNKSYTVGNVTRPQADGGTVCVQAPLTEVSWIV